MFMKLATVSLVLVLILAGVSGPAFAAQSSLPGETLYPIKTFTEDLQLELAVNEQAKNELALEFINRRGDEIVRLKTQGEPIEKPVINRLREQVAFSLLGLAIEIDRVNLAITFNRRQFILAACIECQDQPVVKRGCCVGQSRHGFWLIGPGQQQVELGDVAQRALFKTGDKPGRRDEFCPVKPVACHDWRGWLALLVTAAGRGRA